MGISSVPVIQWTVADANEAYRRRAISLSPVAYWTLDENVDYVSPDEMDDEAHVYAFDGTSRVDGIPGKGSGHAFKVTTSQRRIRNVGSVDPREFDHPGAVLWIRQDGPLPLASFGHSILNWINLRSGTPSYNANSEIKVNVYKNTDGWISQIAVQLNARDNAEIVYDIPEEYQTEEYWDAWHMIAVSYNSLPVDTDERTLTLWFDGIAVAQQTGEKARTLSAGTWPTWSSQIFIGGYQLLSGLTLAGNTNAGAYGPGYTGYGGSGTYDYPSGIVIDEPMFLDSPASDEDIMALYNVGRTGNSGDVGEEG